MEHQRWMPNVDCKGLSPQIAKFMGLTWGPPGSCRPQMSAPCTLLLGTIRCVLLPAHHYARDLCVSIRKTSYKYHQLQKISLHDNDAAIQHSLNLAVQQMQVNFTSDYSGYIHIKYMYREICTWMYYACFVVAFVLPVFFGIDIWSKSQAKNKYTF